MASLLRRTAILSFSRFANKAIVLLSPVLLVRILSVTEYGMYREFLLYAGLIAPLVVFGIVQSLLYFIPKHPEREQVWITQTSLYTLAASTVAIVAIFLAGDVIRANSSFDFVTALQLYILFFTNLNFLECYWLAKKRTDYVLFYTASHLIVRMAVAVTAAWLTEEASLIVLSLVVVEGVRCLLVFGYASYRRWFSRQITRGSLVLQMSYFLPLGAGGVIEIFNSQAGMLFISIMIGPEALAFYVSGAFAMQIVNILRGAIADVIFPEILEMKHVTPKDALPLWKRATVWYCVMLFPVAILFSYYADMVVTVLFTKEYATAIPVFSGFGIVLLLYCFDFHLPLRVQNANRYFALGSVIALSANVGLIYPMYRLFGLVGPVVAFFLSRLLFTVYLANRASSLYKVGSSEIVNWPEVGKVLLASLICAPILVIGKYLVPNLPLRGALFGGAYLAVYLCALRALGVWDAYAAFYALIRSKRAASGEGRRG